MIHNIFDYKGLSNEEVKEARKKYGSNIINKRNTNSFFKLFLESLGDPIIKILLIALGIKMVFLNPYFQNPTGYLLNKKKKEAILDISSKLGIPVIEDDPYSLTAFSGDKISTLKSMDRNGNVLYISSLSKIVASGLRIGWIIGPTSVIERLSDAKQQIDFGHSSYTQWIANDFLESQTFHIHIKGLIKELEKRRDRIIISLDTYLKDLVEYSLPQGGIHLWCKILKNYNEIQLLEESIKRGVIYVPGSTLGSKDGFVRFTFAREDEDSIAEGIKKFGEALKSL